MFSSGCHPRFKNARAVANLRIDLHGTIFVAWDSNRSFRQRPVRQRLMSVRQRLYDSSPTSKILCEIDLKCIYKLPKEDNVTFDPRWSVRFTLPNLSFSLSVSLSRAIWYAGWSMADWPYLKTSKPSTALFVAYKPTGGGKWDEKKEDQPDWQSWLQLQSAFPTTICDVLAVYGSSERQSLQGVSDRTRRGFQAWPA